MNSLRTLARMARAAGPYLLLEMILPGGTLFALALYLHRRGHLRFLDNAGRVANAVGETLGSELTASARPARSSTISRAGWRWSRASSSRTPPSRTRSCASA
jgi:hypothetical protein